MDDPKSLSFRKRRLSLPLFHQSESPEAIETTRKQDAPSPSGVSRPTGRPLIGTFCDHEEDSSNNNNGNEHDDIDGGKAHTFRKRRLSLTTSNTHGKEFSSASSPVEDYLQHATATTTTTSTATTGTNDAYNLISQTSITSPFSSDSCNAREIRNKETELSPFQSRTLHSGELIQANLPPPSPANTALNNNGILLLYKPAAAITQPLLPSALKLGGTVLDNNHPDPNEPTSPALPFVIPAGCSSADSFAAAPAAHANRHYHAYLSGVPALHPKWKKRYTIDIKTEIHKLPFSPDIVGTFSCHGIEPVYEAEVSVPVSEEGETHCETLDQEEACDGNSETMASLCPSLSPDESNPESAGPPISTSSSSSIAISAAKINQDRGGVAFPYGNCPKTALFAVYDGHGLGGELISQFALHEIQQRLEKHSSFPSDLERSFKETFLDVDMALRHEPLIDPLFAGTTACVALLQDRHLTLSNAGDSRAVCARRLANGSLLAMDLTSDQNPDVPEEMERILDYGGYVTLPPGPGLSARVWLDPSCTQIGLAMARSIGDHAVATVGVIAEPVVTTHEVTTDDDFLILASDGVWEFLSSCDAVRIVAENLHRGATKACQALLEAAAVRWHEEEGAYRDDITAIVVRLQYLWPEHAIT